MTTEELRRELRALADEAAGWGCEFCGDPDDDDSLSDRLRALEHRLMLTELPSALPSSAPPLSSGPSDRDAKATPHDAPQRSTPGRA